MESGARVAFELTGKQGAALITRPPTRREYIERGSVFDNYVKRHYDSWVEFARERGPDGKNIRLILVTAVDLTREFAMVAYSDNQSHVECEFSAAIHGVASTSTSVWGSWQPTAGSVHTNCGPHPPWESSSSSQTTALGPEIQDEYTQCVFIKYSTIHKGPIAVKAGPQLPKGNRKDDNLGEEGLQALSLEDSTKPDHPETGSPRDTFDKVINNAPSVGPKHLTAPAITHELDQVRPR